MFGRIHHKKLAEGVVFCLFVLVVAGIAYFGARRSSVNQVVTFGATFSTTYAQSLGLNMQDAYIATLDELHVARLRLPVYWSEVEPRAEEYLFDDLDWMVSEAEKRGVKITLAIGRKVPRWPECYIPDWAEKLSNEDQNIKLLNEIEQIVRRYDASPAIERYQVENEPFFSFGDCPTPDARLFANEIRLVRGLSAKPIQLTTSGENEYWIDTAIPADILGVSMYRVTWNTVIGYSVYPVSPDFYAAKALAVKALTDKVIVSELQAEPWLTKPIEQQSPKDLVPQFTPEELSTNVAFAKQAGFDEISLWGVEYWYWMKLHGQPKLWEKGIELLNRK